MKKLLKSAILVICLLFSAHLLHANLEHDPHEKQVSDPIQNSIYTNEIAAIVNNDIITMERVRMDIAPLIKQIQLESRSEQEFREKLLDAELETINSIINRKLIVEDFLSKGGKLSDTYEKKEYESYLHHVFGGNRLEFAKFLKEYGKSVREFKTDVKERVIIGFMISELRASQPEVSPAKIKEYYDSHLSEFFKPREIELKQIIVFSENNTQSKLQAINNALSNGEEFEKVAKQYSDDFANYNIGYICLDDLVQEIATAINNLAPGTYSEQVILNDTTYIFFVSDEHPANQQTLQEVSHEIEDQLFYQYQEEARIKWIQKLRDKAYIKIFIKK